MKKKLKNLKTKIKNNQKKFKNCIEKNFFIMNDINKQ